MCGIVGYIGPRQAADLLLEGLRRLEYRGYDSSGIAVVNGNGLKIHKAAGKLSMLEQELEGRMPGGTLGIGHTRWATHGAPTTPNAHPHTDQSGRIAVIHNGIIENSAAIRKTLERRGHSFKSETDTEVLAHLVGEYYEGDLEEAVAAALREVDGAYGLAFISADEPGVLVAARKGSPLLVGVGEDEWFVASDASPLLQYTRSVVYLDDGEMVVLTRDGYRERNLETTRISKPVNQIDWDLAQVERNGYPHFMLKEICEQPESLCNTLRGHLLEEEG
ncbi:MAG TPA: glutamine--fructose-6-phosphate aminotransferase, partial [Gemmatimonadales bacterium]|nr:glutamine--fructose-6-phosphate aminotransferase [Gemmatimonadales bacterium]